MGGKLTNRKSDVVIWHNPRCSKSRQALELLRARGVEPRVREYLADAPTAAEIEGALAMLGVEPRALMRAKEPLYRELGLGAPPTTRAALVRAMATHPILIERPVVIRGRRAVLARPPELVAGLFE
jgi:arsenate reductase (glutaredoxin)